MKKEMPEGAEGGEWRLHWFEQMGLSTEILYPANLSSHTEIRNGNWHRLLELLVFLTRKKMNKTKRRHTKYISVIPAFGG